MSQFTSSRFRVGLVGAGYVAPYHLRALKKIPGVELAGVADLDQEKAKALAQQFSLPRACRTMDELIEAGCDVAHILTPPALHEPLAVAAMQRGCHVFVEKPMAETVDACDRMIQTARETGRVLSVNHSARWDPIVLRALDMVRNGACGDVLGADFIRTSEYSAYAGGPLPPPFRNGSYPFQDIGVHGLYLLEAILGPIRSSEVRFYSTLRDPVLYFDEWRALVECERGPGHMYLSWNAKPMQNALVITGTRGILHVDCYLQMLTLHRTYPAPKPIQRMLGEGVNALRKLWLVPANTLRFVSGALAPNPGIQVSVERFYEALSSGTPAPVSPDEGRRVIACLTEVSERADREKERRLQSPPAVRPPRVLVTGAAGFLGGALMRRLRARGESLRLLLRKPNRELAPDDNTHVMYGDLGHPETVDRAVAGVEVVYHIGAAMKGGEAEFRRGTVWGTQNVVEACLRHGVKRLVYVSSMSVFDHAGHNPAQPVVESSPYEPHPDQRGLYTQTKLEAERIVLEAARKRGLAVVVLRPGQIFGAGAEKFPPSGTIGLGGRWLVVGNGRRPVPFVYVEDVVDALLLAEEKDGAVGGIFNLVDPTRITQREYIERALPALGARVRASYAPVWFLTLASVGVALLGKLLKRSVPLTPYRVKSIRPLWPCDITMARSGLGWAPRVGTLKGINETFPPGPR